MSAILLLILLSLSLFSIIPNFPEFVYGNKTVDFALFSSSFIFSVSSKIEVENSFFLSEKLADFLFNSDVSISDSNDKEKSEILLKSLFSSMNLFVSFFLSFSSSL